MRRPRPHDALSVGLFFIATSCCACSSTATGTLDPADASAETGTATRDAGGGEVVAPASACAALCKTRTLMDCAFTRDAVSRASGTFAVTTVTSLGCTGRVLLLGARESESATLALDCVSNLICVRGDSDPQDQCFRGTFEAKQFGYVIPTEGKRNYCAVP